MAQIPESVSSLAQVGGTAATLAHDAVSAVGEFGANLVDSGLKLLQDAGVVEKPKRSKSKYGFLAVLIIIVGGAVAFKVLRGKGHSSASPSFPPTDRLADSPGVAVGG